MKHRWSTFFRDIVAIQVAQRQGEESHRAHPPGSRKAWRGRQGLGRRPGQSARAGRHRAAIDRHRRAHRHGRRRQSATNGSTIRSRAKWKTDIVWGRGAGDQKGAVPAMVYATKIIKDLGLQERRMVAAAHLHRDGRRLRRPLLAVHRARKTRSGRSASSSPTPPTAKCSAASAGEWRSASRCWAEAATARCRKRATTPSTRPPRSSAKSKSCTSG